MHKIFHKNCLRTKPKFKIDIHKNFIIFFLLVRIPKFNSYHHR